MGNYVASSDYIEYANQPDASSDNVLLYSNLIDRAEGIIESYTGRFFSADSNNSEVGSTAVPVSRSFDADQDISGAYLYFDRDICSIETVTNGDSGASTIPSSNFVTEPRNEAPFYAIKLLTSGGSLWTWSVDVEDAITVAGVWAYSKTAPDDIKHATLRLTHWLFKQREASYDADRPALTDMGMVIMPGQIPADVARILAPYRTIKFRGI